MLDAEEAKVMLASVAASDWRRAATKRVGKLRRRLRSAPLVFVAEVPPPGREVRERARRDRVAAAAELDALAPSDLAATMAALHPQFGPALAGWWVDARSQPYTVGWARRSYRAPSAPEITRANRAERLYQLVQGLGPYAQGPAWAAAWGAHLSTPTGFSAGDLGALALGPVLAAAIDQGGPEGDAVLRTLIEVGNGEHPIGTMGRHVLVGLLRSHRVEAWEFVERLLLAAQRQEGLRQAILEVVDESAPEAFTRLLALIEEHDLLRFAATVRAAGVWLGFAADVTDVPKVTDRIHLLRSMREDRRLAESAISSDVLWDVYTGLVAVGMADVIHATDLARGPMVHEDPNIRAAALRFLQTTALTRVVAWRFAVLDDPDLGVAMLAFGSLRGVGKDALVADAFERFQRLAARLPEAKRSVVGLGVELTPVELDRAPVVAAMLTNLGSRPLEVMAPWLGAMDPHTRERYAKAIGAQPYLAPHLRALLVSLVGDRSPTVRMAAVAAMEKVSITPAEAPEIEALLSRKAGDLRRGVIALLASQTAGDAVLSAERLWASGDGPKRDAACELLAVVAGGGRFAPGRVRPVAEAIAADGPSDVQAELLARVLGTPVVGGRPGSERGATVASPPIEVGPGLGLYDPARRSAPRRPHGTRRAPSPIAGRIVSELDDLVERHRDTTFLATTWQGTEEVLLADARWLPSPFRAGFASQDAGGGMVLPEVFQTWWDQRGADLRWTLDGLDALDALALLDASAQGRSVWEQRGAAAWWLPLVQAVTGGSPGELRHKGVVAHVLAWTTAAGAAAPEVAPSVVERCLDGIETTLATVPSARLREVLVEPSRTSPRHADWRGLVDGLAWSAVLRWLLATSPASFSAEQIQRWAGLTRWLDEPVPGASRHPQPIALALRAYEVGVGTEHDVLDRLLSGDDRTVTEWTRRRRAPLEAAHPMAVELADRVRSRVLEIERARGELATPASVLALRLGSVEGAPLAMELLGRLGRASLVRGYSGGNEGRETVYSRLLQVSHPAPDDTPEQVQVLAKANGLKDARLVDLAVFAPQWAHLVERALGWDGLAEGVWWYHAHTKDDRWSVDTEVRETWAALSAERTPLAGQDLVAGAVDVDWYHRARNELGDARWKVLHKAAKLASGGAGHRRAQLFAEAMEGSVSRDALVERIRSKRHQDSVRAFGLVPMPEDPAERNAEALERYQVLREFERGSKAFGSQRQASEGTAVRIGVENLARTAGYPDPQRFVWAMEAAEAGDLADGPVVVVVDDLSVTLLVDPEGTPKIEVRRGDKALAAVPAKQRKEPAIAELRARKTALTRQATRVRRSLEEAMVRGDAFVPADLVALERHPVVAPMLDLVVWVDEAGRTFRRQGADAFVDASGASVDPVGAMRLAHPVDLVGSDWIGWQEQVFASGRRQPFKQVFRELYLLTDGERSSSPVSRRWSGHQIQPRQSSALFGARGWLVDREAGDVSRVFHAHGVVARVAFVEGFGTAAEVELPTIDAVYFTRRGEYLAQPIDQVPPIAFSEAMRDLDLVVSVAHAGGVDPEATASTVEMRAALVRETARMLKLDNVREVGAHVVIEGKLGEYSIHLGSGSVHRRPGGSICIIPVDAQRRGRIFLPFADDDPKTAEVLAKVLLLARDTQIKDPSILEQLRS